MRFTDRLGQPIPIDDVFAASLRHVKIRLKPLDRRRQRHALRLQTIKRGTRPPQRFDTPPDPAVSLPG